MSTPHAIRIHEHGGPEVLRWEPFDPGAPGPGELRVRLGAVGLNFIDTYHRSGLYPLTLPSGLGLEGAGTVEAVGEGVGEFTPGDRVAWGTGPVGSYAEVRVMPATTVARPVAGSSGRSASYSSGSGSQCGGYLKRATSRSSAMSRPAW